MASNFAQQFIGVPGRESHILGNFASPEAKNRTNRAWPARWPICQIEICERRSWNIAWSVDVGSACADTWPSPRTGVLVVCLYGYGPRIKLAASNFARRFIGIQGRKSPIFVSFASQEPKIGRMGERAGHAHPHVNITVEMRRRKRHARDAPS